MKHFITAIFVALSMAATAVQATPSDSEPTLTVNYGDLNLNSAAGDAELYGRLQNAAVNVCKGSDPATASVNFRVHMLIVHQRCMNQSIAKAVTSINQPAFTAYVQGRPMPSLASADLPAPGTR